MHFPSSPLSGERPHSVDIPPLQDAISVLVVDPHHVVREGVKTLVASEPNMRVVGEACDGQTALVMVQEIDPGIVVLEASLPGLESAQVIARLRETRPDRKVLVLTACEHAGSMRLLLGMGALGYVLKRSPAEQLVQALRTVAAGGTYLDPEMARGVVDPLTGAEGTEKTGAELSEREVQVLRLIAVGYSNKEIAASLTLSVKTLETYKTRALKKLELRSRVDIVRFAVRSGWLTDSAPDQLLVSHDDGRPS